MEEFPASKVHLQPATYNLTYWGVSQQTYAQALLASWGVVIEQNSGLHWGEGGWYKLS